MQIKNKGYNRIYAGELYHYSRVEQEWGGEDGVFV